MKTVRANIVYFGLTWETGQALFHAIKIFLSTCQIFRIVYQNTTEYSALNAYMENCVYKNTLYVCFMTPTALVLPVMIRNSNGGNIYITTVSGSYF